MSRLVKMESAGILHSDAISDEIQWINIDPYYVYHPLYAYDEGNYIVLDVVSRGRTFVREQLDGFRVFDVPDYFV